MNLYFWFFAMYALLITPVGMHIHVQMEHGFHYHIRLRAAGLPVKRKREESLKESSLRSSDMMSGMMEADHKLLIALVRQGYLTQLYRVFEWRDLELRVRISFKDAAFTAMAYALIRTILQSTAKIRTIPLRGGVRMDFSGEGSALSFRCIAQARLGSLLAAAIRLILAAVRIRADQLKTEEEQYAAASH